MALQDMHKDVRIVGDGRAALALLGSYDPGVVLLDTNLPDMDACELARRIRRDHPKAHLMLVAISGYSREEDIRRSHDAGIDHHLVKPLDIVELGRVLHGIVK